MLLQGDEYKQKQRTYALFFGLSDLLDPPV